MLRWHWAHATTPAGPGWDTIIDAKVRLGTERGISARAALGEADTITLVVDDPDGTADYKTLHRIYAVETDTPGSQLVWNGYIGDARISRSAEGVLYPTGAGRVWELEVVQENTILGFRVVTGTDGKRPAETAAARLTWLLASSYCSTVHDHGLIDWTGLGDWNMDAVDYRGQTAADVLRDISLISGYNHYARYNDDFAEIELACYEPNTSALDASSVKISNDPADLDPTGDFDTPLVYAPGEDAVLTRQGSRVAAGVYLPYDGGSTYDYSLTTSYTFGFRDMPAPSANVKTLAKAEALRDRLLAQHSSMDERVTCRIQVAAANLNAVKHGQLLSAKFTHFPGWTSYRKARVVSKAFSRPENLTQARYDLDLELSPAAQVSGAFDYSTGSHHAKPTLPHPTTPGRLLVLVTAGSSRFSGGTAPEPALYSGTFGAPAPPWTAGVPWQTANDVTQYGGPGEAVGFAIWWRRVEAEEVTTTPVEVHEAVSTRLAAWLWEIDEAGDPLPGTTYTTGSGGVTSFTVGSGVAGFAFGGVAVQEEMYAWPASIAAVTGRVVSDTDGTNQTVSVPGWTAPRVWLASTESGQPLAATLSKSPLDGGSGTNHWGVCGGTIVIPNIRGIPTIPYPANQVG